MSELAKRHTRLKFTTEDAVRYRGRLRRIVVEVDRDCCTAHIRLEGTHTRFPISFAGIYNHAVKIHVEQQLREKKSARQSKRKGRKP